MPRAGSHPARRPGQHPEGRRVARVARVRVGDRHQSDRSAETDEGAGGRAIGCSVTHVTLYQLRHVGLRDALVAGRARLS